MDKRGGYRRNTNSFQRKKPFAESVQESFNEGFSAIKGCLQGITQLQQRLVDSQERLAKAQENNTLALNQIALYLKHMLDKDVIEAIESEVAEVAPDPIQTPDNPPSQEAGPQEISEGVEIHAVESLEASVDDSEAALKDSPTDDTGTKDAVRIISEMRGNGLTYDKIAEHLLSEGITPIPEDGKWNRWTVGKIYKETVQESQA